HRRYRDDRELGKGAADVARPDGDQLAAAEMAQDDSGREGNREPHPRRQGRHLELGESQLDDVVQAADVDAAGLGLLAVEDEVDRMAEEAEEGEREVGVDHEPWATLRQGVAKR